MASLEQIYDSHANALFAFGVDLTRCEADTYDILQDVFCRLAEKPGMLDEVKDPRAFLLRMVYTRVVDLSRRRIVRSKFAENEKESPLFAMPADPDEALFRSSLERALSELPPDQRAVVHLKLWQGFTFETIADTLDISANTAASRYRYGIDKLRTLLRPLYEEIQ